MPVQLLSRIAAFSAQPTNTNRTDSSITAGSTPVAASFYAHFRDQCVVVLPYHEQQRRDGRPDALLDQARDMHDAVEALLPVSTAFSRLQHLIGQK